MMRIGYDAKRAFHNSRGLGNYSRDLIRITAERTPKARLYLFNPKPTQHHRDLLSERVEEVLPWGYWSKFPGLWRTCGISGATDRYRLDLYHGLSGEIPMNIFKKVPTVVTIHDLIFLRYPQLYSFWDRKIHERKFRYAAEKSHHIIAISEQTRRDLIDFWQIPEEKISVVYQGCHQAFKKNYTFEEKQNVLEKYGLRQPYVLNVGAIEKRKNAFSIVRAIENLEISLVLVGVQTPYAHKIIQYARQRGFLSRIHFLKGVSMQELAMLYQMAEVFCYPSVFEGFGIPIIEALFSRVPVITSQGSCFSEAGGKDSCYIDLNQAETQIRERISYLMSHPQQRLQQIERGFEFVQRFTDEKVYESLMKVYQKILQ